MPYVLPTFILDTYVWHSYVPGVSGAYNAPDDYFLSNMSPGKRTMSSPSAVWEFLCDITTDIRPVYQDATTIHYELIECPQGSKIFYRILSVYDIGKGFANAHRMAVGGMVTVPTAFTDFTYPFPIPLP